VFTRTFEISHSSGNWTLKHVLQSSTPSLWLSNQQVPFYCILLLYVLF